MIDRIRDWWSGLTTNNRVILVASSVGGLVALIGFITWASTPEFVPLYSNLNAQDANSITDKLRERSIPFRLQAGGTAIEVPQPQHDEVLLMLAGQGIQPQNGAEPGWGTEKEPAANSPMNSTEQEAENIRHGREGEVSRIISRMQQVSSAKVIYTPGDASPYMIDADKHPATASVMVVPRSGQQLSDENVQAIVRLTQMAFKGLTEQNISVTDSHGSVLFDGTQAGHFGELAGVKQVHAEELAYTTNLQAVLNHIYPNKTVVKVHLEKTYDQKRTHTISHSDGPIDTRHVSTESYKGNSGDATRVASGATGNGVGPAGAPGGLAPAPVGIPSYAGGGTDSGGNYNREDKTESHANDMTEVETVAAPGQINKLTVAAFVDKSIPADELPKIKEALSTAIGATPNDPAQARLVTVEQVAFEVPKGEPSVAQAENMTRMLSLLVPLGLMLVCFILLARALKRPMRYVTGNQLALASAGMGGGSMLLDDAGMPLAMGADGTPLPGQTVGSALTSAKASAIGISIGDHGPKTYDVIEEAFDSHLESILHMTRNKPETVSALLKAWLTEDE